MNKPELQLVGEDGNIFAIIGRAQRAAKEAGWTAGEIKEFCDKITSQGSYEDALAVVDEYFEVS